MTPNRPRKRKPTGRQRGPKKVAGVHIQRSRNGEAWVLVHPPCASQRAEDLEEVHAMIAGGAIDVAIDELRWLLDGCSDFLAAHTLLGELALSEDVSLARGHFGHAYQLGLTAIRHAGRPYPMPYSYVANRPFFHAGRGLANSLERLDLAPMAIEVIEQLLGCDPTDPIGLARQLEALRTKGRSDRS